MNSSIAGSVGINQLVPYASAKGGVNQLVRTLAVEWAPFGVRVKLSRLLFRKWMQAWHMFTAKTKERHIREWTPLGRRGKVTSCRSVRVPRVRCFLLCDRNILMVDGGWTAV